MKKILILVIAIVCCIRFGVAQTYSATLVIDTVDITGLKAGSDVIIPVRLVQKSGGLIVGFQLYIGFDHSMFNWKGTTEVPMPGIQNINLSLTNNLTDWMFNDNGNQLIAIWIDPALTGVEFKNGDIVAEFIFSYKGGLLSGEKSLLTWGDTYEVKDGIIIKGPTEITSELMDIFVLKYINGYIFNRN